MQKTRLSKALSVLLAVLMLLSVFPAVAFADETTTTATVPEDKGDTDGQPTWPSPGSVSLDKTAAADTDTDEQWELTLTIKGKNTPEKSDVVLVLDNSASMYYELKSGKTRMSITKSTTKDFIRKIWQNDSNIRYSLVVFGTNVQQTTDWYEYSQMDELFACLDSVSRIIGEGQTNIQAGLAEAGKLLQAAPNDGRGKNIVLLTDGAPSAGYAFLSTDENTLTPSEYVIMSGDYKSATIPGTGMVYKSTRVANYDYVCFNGFANTYTDDTLTLGSTPTYAGYWAYDYSDATGFGNTWTFTPSTATTNPGVSFGHQTVWQARQIRNAGINIFAIGYWLLGENDTVDGASKTEAENVLKAVASNTDCAYFVNAGADAEDILTDHYEDIATKVAHPIQDGVVTDVMGEKVEMVVAGTTATWTTDLDAYNRGEYDIYVSQVAQVGEGEVPVTYDAENYYITWKVGTVYESTPAVMKYRVKVRSGVTLPGNDVEFPTNAYAYLEYTNYEGTPDVVAHFPVPEVSITRYFYVAHVQKATSKSEPVIDCIDRYTMTEHFDITSKVSAGHLYGGSFLDEACEDPVNYGDENPANFTPKAYETYYIWEVKEQYLLPYAFRAWYTETDGAKTLSVFHLMTPVDRLLYQEVGFDITGIETKNIKAEKDGTNVAYGTVEMTYNRTPGRTDLVYVDNGFLNQAVYYQAGGAVDTDKDAGYIGMYTLTDTEFTTLKTTTADNRYTFLPYWITLDGVKVTAITSRSCDYVGPFEVDYDFPREGSTVEYLEEYKSYKDAAVADNTANTNNKTQGDSSAAGQTAVQTASLAANLPVVTAYAPVYRTLSFVQTVTLDMNAALKCAVTVNDNGKTSTVYVEKGANLTGTVTPAGAEGMVFAGWYTDATFTTPADLSDVQADTAIYAKYVSDRFLRVSYLQTGLFFVRNVAFVTAVDGGDYQEVGILVNGEKIDVKQNKLLNSWLGIRKDSAQLVFGYHSISDYSYGEKITVTAYWVTADGTTVYGETKTLTRTWYGIRG